MLLASLMACESAAPGEAVAPRADEYAGSAGMILVFAPADAPEDVPLQLRIAEGAWEARIGSDWDEGEPAGSWSVTLLRKRSRAALAPTSAHWNRRLGVFRGRFTPFGG